MKGGESSGVLLYIGSGTFEQVQASRGKIATKSDEIRFGTNKYFRPIARINQTTYSRGDHPVQNYLHCPSHLPTFVCTVVLFPGMGTAVGPHPAPSLSLASPRCFEAENLFRFNTSIKRSAAALNTTPKTQVMPPWCERGQNISQLLVSQLLFPMFSRKNIPDVMASSSFLVSSGN